MAETSAGQAKLDRMLASGMGRQQALKMLIQAQKNEKQMGGTTWDKQVGDNSVNPTQTYTAIEPVAPVPNWTWDDDRGGFKPTQSDSGNYASIGGSLIKINAEPDVPASTPSAPAAPATSTTASEPVKVATPEIMVENIVLDSGVIPDSLIQDLLFEDLAGQEIITIARHDMLVGQPVAYQPIKNIGDISLQYNSENMIYMPEAFKNYFKNFNIVLSNNIPDVEDADFAPNIYNDLDPQSQNFGNVILEFRNLGANQQIEVQILTNGAFFDDTIYQGTGG